MSELEMPTVITAIANSEAEGFVAGTLFAQGWNVVFRAIDWVSLQSYLQLNPGIGQNALLIFGTDLPSANKKLMDSLNGSVRQLIGFSIPNVADGDFDALHSLPTISTDLISLVRGFVRAPLVRTSAVTQRKARNSKVFAIGSAGSYTGCTFIALNLAMELSLLEKSTLLIEANFRAPSLAPLLSMRKITDNSQWKKIAPNLSLSEITQDTSDDLDQFMNRATDKFDYIVLDIGSISGLSNRLTDRRWTSTVTTWCCDQADELMITSRADYLGHHRLVQVIDLLQQTSIRAQLSFTQNMKSSGKRGDAEIARFLTATTALKPIRVRSLKQEARSVQAAEVEHATMVETNERSHLRKAIAELAREIST
jgi:MinD-like ATPase involved in chromosome partitioning or flagellar assembly